ncbi:MAG: hypothetical protein GC191_21025 [Azospirillum sp.]|nr:hypothetical protein [Azospirillum sp.]
MESSYEIGQMAEILSCSDLSGRPPEYYARQLRAMAAIKLIEPHEFRGHGRTAARRFDYENLCRACLFSGLMTWGIQRETQTLVRDFLAGIGREPWQQVVRQPRHDDWGEHVVEVRLTLALDRYEAAPTVYLSQGELSCPVTDVLLRDGTVRNLADHPNMTMFCEAMLVISLSGIIRFLPQHPEIWASGYSCGEVSPDSSVDIKTEHMAEWRHRVARERTFRSGA